MKRYIMEFGLAMLAYVILLPLSLLAFQRAEVGALRIAIALVPVVPAAFGLLAIVRGIERMDELERKIHFEAVAFAFGATALLTFAYGLLQNVDLPAISFTWVLPFMVVLWTLGQAIARRRYS